MSTTCALRQQRGADSWENHKHVSKTPATAGTARGHGRSATKDVIDVASLPPPADSPQPTPDDGRFARRMARVDGCAECVVNYETPSSVYSNPPHGWLSNYVCQACGYAWTTSWSGA